MMKTRDDIFKAINIQIVENERAGENPAFTSETPEAYVRKAAYYVMLVEQAIKNSDRVHEDGTFPALIIPQPRATIRLGHPEEYQ